MKPPDFDKILDAPDMVGSSAYRAMHEAILELSGDEDPFDAAIAECDEFIDWANNLKTQLLEADPRVRCQVCNTRVTEDEPYHGTPCGTFCGECMSEHARECGVCRSEFGLGSGETPEYYPAVFSFDEGPSIVGWTDGRLWNGWGRPIFEAASLADWNARDANRLFWVTPELVVFAPENLNGEEDEEVLDSYRIPVRTMLLGGIERQVYNVGDMGLTWNQVDIEDEDACRVAELAAAVAPADLMHYVTAAAAKVAAAAAEEAEHTNPNNEPRP